MAAKLHVLRRYFKQLALAKRRFMQAAGAAVVASVSLDVAVPAIIATIVEKLSNHNRPIEYVIPLIELGAVSLVGCLMHPVRFVMRRRLQDEGHTRLMEEVVDSIFATPSLGREIGSSARKEFIDTWERFTITLTDQFIPFVVRVLGLITLLAFKLPWVIIPVVAVLIATMLVAYKIGQHTGSRWEIYKDCVHDEHGVMDDLSASANMLWLMKVLVKLREQVGEARSKAMMSYVAAMGRYQFTVNALGSGFKLSMVVGSVILGAFFGESFGVTSFLLIYGLGLGDHMSAVFSMNDMLTSSAAEAEGMVRSLENAEPLGPELRASHPIIELRSVVVEHRDKEREDKARREGLPLPDPTYVTVPDMEIGPGITLFMGESGCGKTSALKAICGLAPFNDEGSITIDGVKVKGHDPRHRIVYVEQEIRALERVFASDLFSGDVASPEVKRALHFAGFAEAPPLDRRIGKGYSGGQKTRLIEAGAVDAVLNRDRSMAGVMALDEPTNHLDAASIPLLLCGLRKIADLDPGLAIVMVTHHEPMIDIADNIVYWKKNDEDA